MNFDFMCPNLSKNNMAEISGTRITKFAKANDNSQGADRFFEKLNMLLGNEKAEFSTGKKISDYGSKKACQSDDEHASAFQSLMDSLAENMKNTKGKDFIDELKSYLSLSGIPDNQLKEIKVNDQSINALEKLLVNAGFDKNDINDMVTQLQLKSEDGKVCLDDLFKSLPKLKNGNYSFKKEDKKKNDDSFAISSLPFLNSIMTQLGIPDDLSGKIIKDAQEDGSGINLDTLIDGLQKLSKKSFISGVDFKTDSDNKSFNRMLEQMGFSKTGSGTAKNITKKDQFTLNDFLAGLEQMRNDHKGVIEQNPELKSDYKTMENADDLSGIFMSGSETGDKGTGKFIAKNITGKDQFTLNDFLAGLEQMRNDHRGVMKQNSASKFDHKTMEKPDDLLDTFMSGLETGETGAGKSVIAGKSMINKSKTKDKLSDSFNVMGFSKDTKTNFSLNLNQGVDKNSFDGNPLASNVTDSTPELEKMLDKVASLVNSDQVNHNSLDGAKRNGEILFDKTDRTSITRVIEPGNTSGGAFRESGLTNRNFASIKGGASSGTLPSYVTNQVVRGLVRAVYRGDNELKLQLKPPELGRMVMKIDNLGDSLKVSIVTENHTARDIIASHENNLKAALAGSGFSIETFDVSTGSNFSQFMGNTGNHSGSGSGHKRQPESTVEISEEIMKQGISAGDFLNDGTLHFVA